MIEYAEKIHSLFKELGLIGSAMIFRLITSFINLFIVLFYFLEKEKLITFKTLEEVNYSNYSTTLFEPLKNATFLDIYIPSVVNYVFIFFINILILNLSYYLLLKSKKIRVLSLKAYKNTAMRVPDSDKMKSQGIIFLSKKMKELNAKFSFFKGVIEILLTLTVYTYFFTKESFWFCLTPYLIILSGIIIFQLIYLYPLQEISKKYHTKYINT